YRRAPENPHPAAQEDALAVVDWLRQVGPALGVDPQRLALGGDSAGAHLALGAALRAPGVPLAALLLLYPALDPTCSADSYTTLSGVGGGLTRAAMVDYWAAYLGRDVDADTLHDPSAAPVRADDAALARLPPCCIVSAAVDPLRDEAEAFATRLTTLGVAVAAWRADGLMHGFARLVQVSPAAAAAMDRAAAWLSATLAR
ncbi:MAG: alpha/beta hydrolase fold domain-containing protein, partial [Alphaproteobacteria bacterium]|nr:alpha/beta hydrolase fold domain-containing protein [Alphaproteobacteria bacterium]